MQTQAALARFRKVSQQHIRERNTRLQQRNMVILQAGPPGNRPLRAVANVRPQIAKMIVGAPAFTSKTTQKLTPKTVKKVIIELFFTTEVSTDFLSCCCLILLIINFII